MNKGFFITFEGIDGCGKSTLATSLKEELEKKGYPTILLREPGGVDISEKIRALLLDQNNTMSAKTEALLYASARTELVEKVIIPALAEEQIVILDRYTDSTLAYQGYGRGISIDFLREINKLSTENLIPDLTFLLDLSPENALKRRVVRDEHPDRLELEGIDFQKKVFLGYRELLKTEGDRIVCLDAMKSPQILLEEVKAILFARIADLY